MHPFFIPRIIHSEDGSVWTVGNTLPDDTIGVNGDFYLNSDTGNLYQKVLGSYQQVANLRGPSSPGNYVCVFNEIPSGVFDGNNVDFTISHAPNFKTEQVFLNGLLQDPSYDYVLVSQVVQLAVPPSPSDRLLISYQYNP